MEDTEVKETKKCRKCQMDIPVNATKCPYCRSSQKPLKIGKIILWIVIIIIGIAVVKNLYTQNEVSKVKNGYLSKYSETISVGQALDSFLSNPKWESGTSEDGTKFVNVTGGCTYLDEPAEITIQFIFTKSGEYFSFNTLLLNGKEQNSLLASMMFAGLYEKAVEGYNK